MKKMKLLLVALLIIMYSCSALKESSNDSKLIIQKNEIKEAIPDTTLFKTSRVIHLETNENSLIRRIQRICIDENKFFIYDKSLNKIVIFGNNGEYLSSVHSIGQDQGEYLGTMDFCLGTNNKQILLLCDRPYKIIYYDYNGKYLKEKKMNDLFFNIISDSNAVYCNKLEISSTISYDFEIFQFNNELNKSNGFLPLRNTLKVQYLQKETN